MNEEPMAPQIEAHDRVEQLRSLLAAAEQEREKRRWHALVRDVVARQRRKR